MGQSNSSKQKQTTAIPQISQLESQEKKYCLAPSKIGKLSLHTNTFPQIRWFDNYVHSFGVLSQLPRDVIILIFKFVLISTTFTRIYIFTNLALVSKSFRVMCSDVCKLHGNFFGIRDIEEYMKHDWFFQDRWHIFHHKYCKLRLAPIHRQPEFIMPIEREELHIITSQSCEIGLYGDHKVGKTALMRNLSQLLSRDDMNAYLYGCDARLVELKFQEHPSDKGVLLNETILQPIVFLVFDITNLSSLEYLRIHATILSTQNVETTRAVLVGNKIDEDSEISDSGKQAVMAGIKFASEFSLPFVMCSATKFTSMLHLAHLVCGYPSSFLLHLFAMTTLQMNETIKRMDQQVGTMD